MARNFTFSDYAARLDAETACPCCCADRNMTWGLDPAADSRREQMMIAAYDCGATFQATARGIAAGDPCPASANVAAQMLTYEAHMNARDAAKGRAA
jgi:hypothetical protein